MSDPFNHPSEATNNGFDIAEAINHLILTHVVEVVEVPTKYGEREAVRVNVEDIDTGETHEDVLLFGKVLVASLREQVGNRVLGRIGQGEARGGNNPPWILRDYTDADRERALNHLSGNTPAPAAGGGDNDQDDDDILALRAKLEEKQKKLLETKLGAKAL